MSRTFELERLDQARLERLTAEIGSSDDDELDAVHQLELQCLPFFLPSGVRSVRLARPVNWVRLFL